jgi:fructose-specific phosphotransferase system IIC component
LARLKKCYHYDQDETIQQIFILCPLARVVWHIVYMAFNISPPKNITNLFEKWLVGVEKKAEIRVGVCALLWVIWNVA